MGTTIQAQPQLTGELAEFREGQILCTTSDFQQFVVSEEEAVKACLKSHADRLERDALGNAFELTMRQIADWCRGRPIAWCAIAPRSEDLLVVMWATNEDPTGELHDAMADLDLELYDRTKFELSFLLFRAAEAGGITAFIDSNRARIIYSAERETAQRGSR